MACVQYFLWNVYPICHALSICTGIPWYQDLTCHAISCHTDEMPSSSDSSLCVLQFVLHASHPLELHSCHFLAQNLSVPPCFPWWLIYNLLFGGLYHQVMFLAILYPLPSPANQGFMKMLYSLLRFSPQSSCHLPLAQHPPFVNLSHSTQRLTRVLSSTWNLLSSPPTLTELLLQEHLKAYLFGHRFALPHRITPFLCGPVLAPGIDGKLLDFEHEKTIFLLTLNK